MPGTKTRKSVWLLPRLSLMAIRRNAATYLPYIGVCVFAMFVFFVFGLILHNDVVNTLPRAAYAGMLMLMGQILLGLVMIPFLYYTNSFLIKRRKRELGLYRILGMEKKHIGLLMFYETLLIYVIVVVCAVVLGLLFSRLLFLFLLNLAELPVNASFHVSFPPVAETFSLFGLISLINLGMNLYQVGKANPVELLGESGKGEKEPRHIWLFSLIGAASLGRGYWIALTAQMNSKIFDHFFMAVFFVMLGTYFLFTSGSILVLRALKRRASFYYRPENFVTVSGMLYRMKKNAAGLVNICLFSTMVIITVTCTVAVYQGIPMILQDHYPYRIQVRFLEAAGAAWTGPRGEAVGEAVAAEARRLALEEGVALLDYQSASLEGDEAGVLQIVMNLDGNEEAADAFSRRLDQSVSRMPGFASFTDNWERMQNDVSMYGGLLFIGIAFGSIFLICVLIAMFYKQITEGFEDRKNFVIMHRVGLSGPEALETVQKQMRLVFYLPMAGALIHTVIALRLVNVLLGSIDLHAPWLVAGAALAVSAVFTGVYYVCCRRTARTYYRIALPER